MRSTIHLVSRADYWPLAVAIRDARRDVWQRATKREPLARRRTTLRAALRERADEAQGDRGADRQGGLPRHRAVGRHGARAAVGHLGASPCRPLRARRGLGRAARRHRRRGARPPRHALPDGLRAGVEGRDRQLGRARSPATSSRRSRGWTWRASRPRTAPSCSTCPVAAPRRRHARSSALPRHLGRGPARARPARAGPARGAPREDLPRRGCRSRSGPSSSTARWPGPGSRTGRSTAFDGEPNSEVHDEFGRLMAFCA